MFAKPRIKKVAPPPPKKRKATSAVEDVSFDFDAREEYLTGFHKRKQQRIKFAQDQAAKKAREEKIELRKQVRLSSSQLLFFSSPPLPLFISFNPISWHGTERTSD